MVTSSRDENLQAVFDNMQQITRRVNDRARHLSNPLTFVEYSLLRHIEVNDGIRAVDLAEAFSLNRSTVSRQVANLMDLGLAEYDANGPGRGRVLKVTEYGESQLGATASAHGGAVTDRLADWSDDEIRTFAQGLQRYNGQEAD